MSIHFRRAKSADVKHMRMLAIENQIDDDLSQEFSKSGFIIWPLSEAGYVARIEQSDHVFVAETGNEIVGHVMGMTMSGLKAEHNSTDHANNVFNFLSERYSDDVVVLDQIVIAKKFHRTGIGSRLVEYFMEVDDRSRSFVTDIVHRPIRNEASIRFFESAGFSENHQVVQEPWTLGIYEHNL